MSNDNQGNYDSHYWIGGFIGGPSDPEESVSYCRDCGIENLGNPAEFGDGIEYPNCNDGSSDTGKDFWSELYAS